MSTTAKHVIVKGMVQGVFYRKFAKQKAIELGVRGWVKNTDNGNVEIFAQGSEEAVERLSEWCWQGSPKSEVKDVEVRDIEPDPGLESFSIQH